jgi:hypothetical protein
MCDSEALELRVKTEPWHAKSKSLKARASLSMQRLEKRLADEQLGYLDSV